MRTDKKLKQLILASVFTAITAVLTFYIKIPMHNGYLHLGDAMIYLSACLLPAPFALVTAALGGILADSLGGFIVYAVPTAIIKPLMTCFFSSKGHRIITKRNLTALVPASLVTVGGYYIAEVILISISSGGFSGFFSCLFTSMPWVAAVYTLPGNTIQAVASAIVFILLSTALDKIKIKDRI